MNKWDDTQRCQQLAVSLRGRAQMILKEDEKLCFDDLEKALQSRIQPEQQRKIHKLTFNARRRKSGENIVDLATDLRQLAALAYQGTTRGSESTRSKNARRSSEAGIATGEYSPNREGKWNSKRHKNQHGGKASGNRWAQQLRMFMRQRPSGPKGFSIGNCDLFLELILVYLRCALPDFSCDI